MADALGTVLNVIELVNKAVDLYHKIHDCPDQLRLIGARMERLSARLAAVRAFLATQTIIIDASRAAAVLAIVEDIRGDTARVAALFARFRDDVGPLGYQFRFRVLTQVWFALGSSADEMRDLAAEIEKHRLDLREELQFMGIVGINAIHQAVVVEGQVQAPAQAQAQGQNQQQSHAPAQGTTNQVPPQAVVQTPPPPPTLPLLLSPPPPPAYEGDSDAPATPQRSDFSILFVDPYNGARSTVAEAHARLLRAQHTLLAGAGAGAAVPVPPWRVRRVHSAGFFVRSRGRRPGGARDDAAIEGLSYPVPSYRLPMADGDALLLKTTTQMMTKTPTTTTGAPPNNSNSGVALAALFEHDGGAYEGRAFEREVRRELEARRPRGLVAGAFKTYDYILVFTDREHDNLVRLRRALIARDGKQAVSGGGKGRVVYLGNYGLKKLGKKPVEILEPKGKEGEDRALWNARVGQIKTAVEGFLKREMGWEQPKSIHDT